MPHKVDHADELDPTGPDPNRVYYAIGGNEESRPILTGDKAKATFNEIPLIDLSDLRSPDLEKRKALATKIRAAAQDVGFFTAYNAPVDPSLIDAAFASLPSFFSLPEETRRKLFVDNSPAAKGWYPLKHPSGVYKRESFGMGTDYTNPEQHFIAVAPPGSVAINQWPDEDAPELRKALYAYYAEVFAFAMDLVRIFALSCDLDEHAFDEYFKKPLTDITVQRYPALDIKEAEDEPIVTTPAHADYCLFTLLLQNNQSGLEVLNANGIWVPCAPLDYGYVVNVGNYMEVLTNGLFTSTVHRVVSYTGAARTSLPFFLSPSPDVTIAPLPSFVGKGEEPKYEPYAIGPRQVKAMMAQRKEHPFVKAMVKRGLKEEDYRYELLSRPTEEYIPSH